MKKYNACDYCNALSDCPLLPVGYMNGTRCRFNLRGYYNDKEITKEKYKTFECDNLDQIKKQINEHKSIYLWGTYGKGKTHFSKWLANIYNLRGNNVYIKLSADIIKDLREEIQFNKSTGEVRKSITDKMREIDVLFIDDLGQEKMTEFVHECLQVVIDDRYRNEKPTFITSNYSFGELYNIWSDKIGETKAGQLVSRIKTFGVIEIESKNWRK